MLYLFSKMMYLLIYLFIFVCIVDYASGMRCVIRMIKLFRRRPDISVSQFSKWLVMITG